MTQDTTQTSPTESPDLLAIELDLRRWSWATGGWASLHAFGGVLLVASGALVRVPSNALRLVVIVLVGAWAVAAIASWQFRRSFHARRGYVGAGASIVAGVVMGVTAIALGTLEGIADGIAHFAAGVGFARAVSQARPFLHSP